MSNDSKIIIDAKTNKPIEQFPMGLTGCLSWSWLAESVLRKSGDIGKDEIIEAFSADKNGIQYTIQNKPQS